MIILVTVFQTPTMETRSGHFSNYLSFFSKLWYGGNRRKNLDLSLKQMMRLREYVQGCVYSEVPAAIRRVLESGVWVEPSFPKLGGLTGWD